MGIEPTWSAWKAEVLPLNYTRSSNAKLYYNKCREMSTAFFIESKISINYNKKGIDTEFCMRIFSYYR